MDPPEGNFSCTTRRKDGEKTITDARKVDSTRLRTHARICIRCSYRRKCIAETNYFYTFPFFFFFYCRLITSRNAYFREIIFRVTRNSKRQLGQRRFHVLIVFCLDYLSINRGRASWGFWTVTRENYANNNLKIVPLTRGKSTSVNRLYFVWRGVSLIFRVYSMLNCVEHLAILFESIDALPSVSHEINFYNIAPLFVEGNFKSYSAPARKISFSWQIILIALINYSHNSNKFSLDKSRLYIIHRNSMKPFVPVYSGL